MAELEEQAAGFVGTKGSIGFGSDAVREMVHLEEADVVVNALVGAAGLQASYETLRAGKVLALANKESLVVGGNLIMPMATEPGMLMPIDSEHGAIYQCLLGEDPREVSKLWVTASGGPFRGRNVPIWRTLPLLRLWLILRGIWARKSLSTHLPL